MAYRFDILTLFPNLCQGYLQDSILKRAQADDKVKIQFHNIRDFSHNKHKQVDDTPYGGGAGMIMTPQPLYDCIQHAKKLNSGPVIFFTPQGEELTQSKVEKLSTNKEQSVILLCGRYEGIDQRIRDMLIDQEISIGQYVLTGGELPALVLLDAITRLIPGVLGSQESHQNDSFSKKLQGHKKYPVYTKPAEFMGEKVPDVLLSGNHAEIQKWQLNQLKSE